MPNKDIIEVNGEVVEALPNTMFRVLIDEQSEQLASKTILCTLSGKMRMYRIRVMPGDKVTVTLTPYDLNRGRITFRSK